MLTLEINGPPIPWKRPGVRRFSLKEEVKTIVYDRQKREKELVRWQLNSQFQRPILTVPLLVGIVFRMTIPKSTSKIMKDQMLEGKIIHHMKKPDIDNLTKFILDCMNQLIFTDDAQICTLYAKKIYAITPGTGVRIKPYTMNDSQELFNKETNEIEEEFEDEDTIRGDRRGELHRVCNNQKRIKFTTGEETN